MKMYYVKKNDQKITLYKNFDFIKSIINNQDSKIKSTSKFFFTKSYKVIPKL